MMMFDTHRKMQYIRAYIHFRKNVHVNIQPPQNENQEMLLAHMFHTARGYMTSIGKEINIDGSGKN